MISNTNNRNGEILVLVGFVALVCVAVVLAPETGGASLLLIGA